MADSRPLHFVSWSEIVATTQNSDQRPGVISVGRPHLDREIYAIADNGSHSFIRACPVFNSLSRSKRME